MELAGEQVLCPYCGELQELDVDRFGPADETFTQDCEVCCRPWVVRVTRALGEEEDPGEVTVTVGREDD